jgi:uroporphyrinogen decarboxylase
MERKPDFKRLEKVLLRDGEPDHVPFYELYADKPIMEAILRQPLSHETYIRYQLLMGYDYVCSGTTFQYTYHRDYSNDTRFGFVDNNHGLIENRSDFDAYPWPKITGGIEEPILSMQRDLPQGMKLLVSPPAGILENVMWLMGFIPLSYALYEDEQLVFDMFERIGTGHLRVIQRIFETADRKTIGGVVMGDDMGYNMGPMLSPAIMRKYVFPWQQKLVARVHDYGVPFILHSCGNLDVIMDDLIDFVKIDARHSYEDKIMPVARFKQKYGNRVAVLGGFDIDKICRSTPEEVYDSTKQLIRDCAPGGGWALGTGNSVTSYVPVENFRAMMKAGLDFG